jgi:uncharacterized MAPEG superfamily protein
VSIPVAALLAFALWTITLLAFTIGVLRWTLIFSGRAELKSFPGDEPHGSPFYRRATRAHANCVENLPVFGAIVFAAEASGAHRRWMRWPSSLWRRASAKAARISPQALISRSACASRS